MTTTNSFPDPTGVPATRAKPWRALAPMAAAIAIAPFTPSNTARSAGSMYPVIRHLPELYDSGPNDPSARKIGSYIMWVGMAATSVTSSMFLTAMAPNLIALEMVKKTTKLEYGWTDWFVAYAPVGIVLLLATPLLTYWLYPPEIKAGDKVPAWAKQELDKIGALTWREMVLAALVALVWMFGGDHINATTVALLIVSLMLVLRAVSWEDVIKYSAAWNTLAWFATLLALADGLSRVGFVKWFAQSVAQHMGGLSPLMAMLLPVPQYAMLLCLTLGLMGIISPYATGPRPVYYGSGYLPPADCWRLGGIFGVIFPGVLLLIGAPWRFAVR